MTKSQAALRLGLDNNPSAEQIESLTILCEKVLEPVRQHFNRPVIINSGYRTEAVNRVIGGKGTSQHCRGQAADIEIPGVDNLIIYQWIHDADTSFDQLILEYYIENEPGSGWVHVSYVSRETNRRERLRLNKSGIRRE
jgi:zinc D-Ala-D-Ala carboxypeptidase